MPKYRITPDNKRIPLKAGEVQIWLRESFGNPALLARGTDGLSFCIFELKPEGLGYRTGHVGSIDGLQIENGRIVLEEEKS